MDATVVIAVVIALALVALLLWWRKPASSDEEAEPRRPAGAVGARTPRAPQKKAAERSQGDHTEPSGGESQRNSLPRIERPSAPPEASARRERSTPPPVPPPAMADDEALEREREERRKALRRGLKTTRGGFIAKLGDLLRGKKELDADLLGEIEELLLTADVGVQFTETLVSGLKKNLSGQELQDPDAVWAFLREQALAVLAPAGPAWDTSRRKPFVVMVIGVNGVGKTTTIAKLASRYVKAGQKVVLAAGDTFRAAAVRQLEMWGARVGAEVVKRDKAGADPSAVVFDAIERGVEVQADIVIADTAGRLHTKSPLMEELKKVNRVMGKALDGSPHEVLLVLDANTGQNANQQVKQFKEAMDLTGIVLTKLDGTAKGGVILGICAEHGIPIRFIGVGEKDDDLRQFDAEDFVDVLFERPEKSADTAA